LIPAVGVHGRPHTELQLLLLLGLVLKKLGPSWVNFLKVSWLSESLFNLSFMARLLPVGDYMLVPEESLSCSCRRGFLDYRNPDQFIPALGVHGNPQMELQL
jgi:hypothetical protein